MQRDTHRTVTCSMIGDESGEIMRRFVIGAMNDKSLADIGHLNILKSHNVAQPIVHASNANRTPATQGRPGCCGRTRTIPRQAMQKDPQIAVLPLPIVRSEVHEDPPRRYAPPGEETHWYGATCTPRR
jgi:hypothetical protein